MTSLQEFIDFLDKRALDTSSYVFDNPYPEKASEVFQAMIRHSNYLCVYIKNFSGSISKHGNFIQTLETFLRDEQKSLNIMVDDDSPTSSILYATLKEHINRGTSNLSVKTATEKFKELMEPDDGLRYFAVADKKRYRVESDNERHIAVCDFYDPGQGEVLQGLFNIFYTQSNDVIFN